MSRMKLTCAELSQGRLETGAFNTSCSLGYLMAQESEKNNDRDWDS